jgi:hypothetical protein
MLKELPSWEISERKLVKINNDIKFLFYFKILEVSGKALKSQTETSEDFSHIKFITGPDKL